MHSRDWRLRVSDILDAIRAVTGYVSGMTFDDFVLDQRTIDAVVRRFIIIGEAAGRVPEHICAKASEIPWADMRAMRNFVVHEYFGVNEKILWDTIHNDLPAIVGPLERLMEDDGGG